MAGVIAASIDKDFRFSIKESILAEFIYTLSVESPIMVLVITLILTIHQASGWPAPPNLKNSTNSNKSQQINNNVKDIITLPILNSIFKYIRINYFFLYNMKARDDKGRFKKEIEDSEFIIKFPSIKTVIHYFSLIIIFLPWLIIVSRLNLSEKIISAFDLLLNGFNGKNEDTPETGKKNGLFY